MVEYLFSFYYIYIYISLIIVLYILYDRKNEVRILWWVMFPLLVFHDGFRWETGNDWTSYLEYFENCYVWQTRLEVGYQLLNKLVFFVFGNSYTVFLIIWALIYYYLICDSFTKYSSFPILSLFLLYCGFLGFLGTNRNLLAFAICLYSIRYFYRHQYCKYLICVLVACLFHNSALVFMFLIFMNRKYSLLLYIVVAIISFGISYIGLVDMIFSNLLGSVSDNYIYNQMEVYSNAQSMSDYTFSYLMILLPVLRKVVVLLVSYVRKDVILLDNKYFYLWFNMYFASLVITLLFYGSSMQIFVSRLGLYFLVAEFILIAEFVYSFKKTNYVWLLSLIAVLYGSILVTKSLNESSERFSNSLFIPYKGVFINNEYKRTMW